MIETQTALAFVDAINAHDIERIYSLMTNDHLFIDTYASEVHGKENMKKSWINYFEWFPDYLIEVKDVFVNGNKVAIFGIASGTYHKTEKVENNKRYQLPAAWKVIVEDGKVKLWQVICDSKIPFDIMFASGLEQKQDQLASGLKQN